MPKTLRLVLVAVVLSACGGQNELPDFTALVADASPAIVNISGRSTGQNASRQPVPEHPFFNWFRDFVEPEEERPQQPPPQRQRPEESLGSGFIISANGEIVTNYHVVADVDEVIVTLADRRQFEAEVVGKDPASDMALLRIKASGLPFLRFGQSKDLQVGAWVLAIGSPFGFEQTATAGIVSGKRRALNTEQYVPFLQTDVAINPGNSGGPLFNLDGEVIGINSQIYSQTGGYMGLSFAIPADTAKTVLRQLRQHGRVRRGWLGVTIQDVDRALAESFQLDRASGALVSQVDPDGPAARGGVQAGDVILEVNGEIVPSSGALPPMVGRVPPGEKVDLLLMRDGKTRRLSVKLGELQAGPQAAAAGDWTGLELVALNDQRLDRLELQAGLLVREVRPDAAGDAAGLRPRDIIVSFRGQPLRSLEQFNALAEQLAPGESAPLLVRRGERNIFLALERGPS